MCTVIQYRATSKVNEGIRVVFRRTARSDWPTKMAPWIKGLDWIIALMRHQLENQKDSHSIKDFFRLNPHEHENMDIDAIPKHHKIGFPKELLTVPWTKWGASSRCSSGPNAAFDGNFYFDRISNFAQCGMDQYRDEDHREGAPGLSWENSNENQHKKDVQTTKRIEHGVANELEQLMVKDIFNITVEIYQNK